MKYKAVNATAAISCFPAFRMKFKEFQLELCACARLVSFVEETGQRDVFSRLALVPSRLTATFCERTCLGLNTRRT